ncbi:spermatogenesis-associated protein 48 [Callorhinchus milii]|uniref:spermatogenesis-associated protein 48 n=1 Tax=Callorhinchus milii TaxID=7868 RepID=UPI001C3F5820|nr:spermatogenesis-associated protein 48 [Callorhinchus milii]
MAHALMPFVRGPEDRHYFTSFLDQRQAAFTRWSPFAEAPDDNYPLAPLRRDVPLVDPCSGFVSAGADADLETGVKAIPSLVDLSGDVRPNHRAPNPAGRSQTPPNFPSFLEYETADDKQWNSRAVSTAALRAREGGWTSPVRVTPSSPRVPSSFKTHNFNFVVDPSEQVPGDGSDIERDLIARKYMYTSMTQRSYEDVHWDAKLPPKIKPPDATQEKKTDRVTLSSNANRYEPTTQQWQAITGFGIWDKFQSRPLNNVTKPITFSSPFPRIHQIPLYSGCFGGINTENVDNPHAEFTPFTMVRTQAPKQYQDVTHRPNLHTDKWLWPATQGDFRTFSPTADQMYGTGYPQSGEAALKYKHHAPFAKIVATIPPFNPFNKNPRRVLRI